MQFSESPPHPLASRSTAAVSSVAARGESQKYYQEVFRQREIASLEASQEALAQGVEDVHELASSAMPATDDDPEATRAMQLTGLRANDPFLASANARFQARLEARNFGGGARRLQQHDARDALAAALRRVEAAKAAHQAAMQAQEVFNMKTGGEPLSAQEILRERMTADRLRRNTEAALEQVKAMEREQAKLQAEFDRAGCSPQADTLVCTPATVQRAHVELNLDVTLPDVADDTESFSSHASASAQHRIVRSPPTRQRRRTREDSEAIPRSEDNLMLRRNVRMSSMPEGALSPVLRRTAVRRSRPASLPALVESTTIEHADQREGQPDSKPNAEEIEQDMALEVAGRRKRRGWQGQQTVAGQLLSLSREEYRNQRRPSYANDGKPRRLLPECYDPTLSRSGKLGAYMSLEKSVTGAWRGRHHESSGGFGNLAVSSKLENNLVSAWRSLAARRAASEKAALATTTRRQQRWSSPYKAVRSDRAIRMGAAGGAIEKILNI